MERGLPLRKISTSVLILALLSSGMDALRAEEIPESFVPVRPNAVGGAFTAIANDEDAIWTNPAGIARIRKARSRSTVNLIKVPALVVGANTKSREFIQGVGNNSDNADQIAAQADQLGDKPFWATTGAYPLMMFDIDSLPAVVGAYTTTTLKSVVNEDNPELANTNAISDVGGIFGVAFTNKSNRFNVGLQARYLARYAYEDKVPLTTLADGRALQKQIKDKSNKSTALAVDMGMLWTFADFWFPTIGVAVLNAPGGCRSDYLNPFSKSRINVCGTVFSGEFANEEAVSTVDPTDIRAGISITPRFGHKLGARIAVDMHHNVVIAGDKVYGLDGLDLIKQLHAGIEFFTGNPLLPSPLTFAFGLNQGYYTVGASVRLGALSLDFASFGRDISSTASPKEDRRLLGGLSLDF